MKRTYLGEFEEVVRLTAAVLALQNQAYSVAITHEINEETGRDVRLNQIHAALQRLEDKGMVQSHTWATQRPNAVAGARGCLP